MNENETQKAIDYLLALGDGSLSTIAKDAGIKGNITNYDVLDEIREYVFHEIKEHPEAGGKNVAEKVFTACQKYAAEKNNKKIKQLERE